MLVGRFHVNGVQNRQQQINFKSFMSIYMCGKKSKKLGHKFMTVVIPWAATGMLSGSGNPWKRLQSIGIF